MEILNSKEIKKIMILIKDQWGSSRKLDYAFFRRENDIFLMNRDFSKIDFEKVRINSIGLYIGEIHKHELRLSVEGSQLIGPIATKNIANISEKDMQAWLRGKDIENDEGEGFVLVKHGTDFLGCGKQKNGKILNYVPKARRIQSA